MHYGWNWAASAMMVIATPALAQQAPSTPVDRALEAAAHVLTGLTVPSPDAFVTGDREVAAGTTVTGPVAATGTVRVAGTVDGDVFAYEGDVILVAGGHIRGSAVAINGRVQILEGGTLDGDTRAYSGPLDPIASASAVATTRDNVMLTLGWAGVVLIIGIGVMVFGGRTLDVVGETIGQEFGRSLIVGIAATLGAVPALALLIVGLALTILGVLLIPFAIVAYVLAAAGLLTLGFLAAVRATGRSISRGRGSLTERGAALRALVVGVVFFLGLWLIAAFLTSWPAAESVARVVAFAITWAAATVGLGATIISRGGSGVRRHTRELVVPPLAADPAVAETPRTPDWLTPTPVSGVKAARRPTPPPQRSPT
jgi:hypothetical protein